jgi:hypothetical protein
MPLASALGGLDRAHRIEDHRWLPEQRSITFDGRDIFAPTAAALASGRLRIEQIGPPCVPMDLALPTAQCVDGEVRGEVVAIDHFGNLITNVEQRNLDQLGDGNPLRVHLPGCGPVKMVSTYGDVARGDIAAMVGSGAMLEVAVRDGSAATRLALAPGVAVLVTATG